MWKDRFLSRAEGFFMRHCLLLAASAALVLAAPAHAANINDIIGFGAPIPACLDI